MGLASMYRKLQTFKWHTKLNIYVEKNENMYFLIPDLVLGHSLVLFQYRIYL